VDGGAVSGQYVCAGELVSYLVSTLSWELVGLGDGGFDVEGAGETLQRR